MCMGMGVGPGLRPGQAEQRSAAALAMKVDSNIERARQQVLTSRRSVCAVFRPGPGIMPKAVVLFLQLGGFRRTASATTVFPDGPAPVRSAPRLQRSPATTKYRNC